MSYCMSKSYCCTPLMSSSCCMFVLHSNLMLVFIMLCCRPASALSWCCFAAVSLHLHPPELVLLYLKLQDLLSLPCRAPATSGQL